MEVSFAELIDRFSILVRKKLLLSTNEDINKEFEAYKQAISQKLKALRLTIDGLSADVLEEIITIACVNSDIWNLEAAIRGSNYEELYRSEIGKRAEEIRDFNKKRVNAKNRITSKVKDGFKDIKVNHASQDEAFGNRGY